MLAGDDVAAQVANSGLAAAALDVHAAATNNLMYTGYLVLTAFVFVVGDSVVADLRSGYASLVLTRVASPVVWWLSKLCAVTVAAIGVQVVYLAACVAVGGMWRGWPITRVPSVLAAAASNAPGMVLFPPVESSDMLLRQALVAAYLVVAFSACTALLMSVTTRSARRSVPVTVALLGLMADYLLAKAWDPWFYVSPGLRLLEGAQTGVVSGRSLPLWSSLLYFAGMALVAAAIGSKALRRKLE